MKIGISALKFNLEDALNICKKNKKISHIEMGIDNLEDVESLKKYKDEINKLNLSISIHLPMELNTCEDIKFINNLDRYKFSKARRDLKEETLKRVIEIFEKVRGDKNV